MRRKWIGLLLAAVMTMLPMGGLAAGKEDTMTAEDVERLVYTDTMAEQPRAEEMLNLTYMLDNDVESRVRLGDLIVPEKSVILYPYVWRSISNDGYLDKHLREPAEDYYQRMQDYIMETGEAEHYNAIRWICTAKADESKYYIVDIQETDGTLSIPYLWEADKIAGPNERTASLFVDRLSFDFEKMAQLINAAALGRIDHILIAEGATYIDCEAGDYFIFECPLVNGSARYLGRDEAPELPAETFIPVNDYIAFANQWYQDRKDAYALLRQKIVEKAGYPEAGSDTYYADDDVIIPDTDSLAPYLGQVSKYPDVARLYPGQEGERLQAVLCQLTDRGALTGKAGGDFAPADVLLRGEAAAMVGRLFRLVPDSVGSVFSDVTPDYYAAGYIAAMHQMGILNGYEDGTFRPEAAVTYSELFMMVTSLLGGVADSFGVKDYFPEGADKAAVEKGLCDDLGGVVTDHPITRQDAALVLSRALDAHITTICDTPSKMSVGWSTKPDLTLAAYLDGGTLQGEVMYTQEQEKAYEENLQADWEAEYGVIKQIYNYYSAGEFEEAERLERQLAQ